MSESRPTKTTINGTLEQAEQKFNEYQDSHKGSTELQGYTRVERTPTRVNYTAMSFAFGEVGMLKLVALPTAVTVSAEIWQPSAEQLSAFMAPGNFGRRAIAGNALALADELLRIPERNRLVHFRGHILAIWQPIGEDIVEFMGAGVGPIAKPNRHGLPSDFTKEKLAKLEKLRADNIREFGHAPQWTATCALAKIHPRTAEKHAPELHSKWYETIYPPKSRNR